MSGFTVAHNLAVREAAIKACYHCVVGTIGDDAHTEEHSDHNRDARNVVHAIDTMVTGANAAHIVEWCLSQPADLEYIIHNRQIWDRSTGFQANPYNGSDPHTDHVHISGRHGAFGYSSRTGTGYDVDAEKMTPSGSPCKPTYLHPVGSRDVVQGMAGHDVRWIQMEIGEEHMGDADGKAGPTFTRGVKWWQGEHHLAQDGRVGKDTYATMGVKEHTA